METLAVGQVVTVDFPFSDQSASKLRSAVILASAIYGDFLMAPITSNPFPDPDAVSIEDDDFVEGGLRRPSFLHTSKLYTTNRTLVDEVIGELNAEMHLAIIKRIYEVMQRKVSE